MDFIDLKTQQKRIKETLDTNIQKVLAHGQYIMGPEVGELEERLAAYVGVKHAVSCASGTDALLMALMACGVGPGDAIFTTPFTFVATAEVISLLGATPVFVDIDPPTWNIDPARLEQAIRAVEANDPTLHPLPAIGGNGTAFASAPFARAAGLAAAPLTGESGALRPRGIIPVDLFGLPAAYDAIASIARDHGLFLIEDAAQSFGAEYNGKKTCSFGQIGCTSFFPAKPLGCYGDGGMCFTGDDALAAALRSLRIHGQGRDKYDNARIGINGRMDTLQAAILLAKMDIFPEEIELRQTVAQRYNDLITNAPAPAAALPADFSRLTPQHVPANCKSAWAQYSVLAKSGAERMALMERLRQAGIPTAIYYPKPLHLQGAFANLGYRSGAFPASEDAASRIFSLPMHPYLQVTGSGLKI
ncbi:MAG: DegT/DnrJ/EryC1/StrS family aminotransferase [Syntrophobacterales bacterium]|nr:DegT/DnrJ/EryC1/StrS family aminotransferase [Syntrophobacterales bacterium]